MKSLLVVRHAKSSWEWEEKSDFDRPLNERGKRDAPVMAQRLVTQDAVPDLFVSSPAKRARKTAEIFAAELGYPVDDILFKPELYHAASATFYEVVGGLDDRKNVVVLFSHNPGITDFVNSLTDARIDHMPTCAIFGVHADIARWSEFRTGAKRLWLFDYPKA